MQRKLQRNVQFFSKQATQLVRESRNDDRNEINATKFCFQHKKCQPIAKVLIASYLLFKLMWSIRLLRQRIESVRL